MVPAAPGHNTNMTSSSESLITYPCDFPIKVMGPRHDDLLPAVLHVAHSVDPSVRADDVQVRPSRAGNYVGLTLTVRVHSRAQLDELYRTLSTHPLVRVVL
jgi:putative lipoic acid-binding regulatory protein